MKRRSTWWKRYEPRWVRLAPRNNNRAFPLSHVTMLDATGDPVRANRNGTYMDGMRLLASWGMSSREAMDNYSRSFQTVRRG